MIFLISAVPLETSLLRQAMSPCEVRNSGGRDLFLGSIGNLEIGLIHSGVGKANAAAASTSLITFKRPEVVINLGCGGAYPGSGLEVGDLALATEEVYGDEGALTPEGFLDMEALGLPMVQRKGLRLFNRYPADPALLKKSRSLLSHYTGDLGKRLGTGPFVTVSTCSGTLDQGILVAERTRGICENMEGASVAQVCALNNIPFLEVRGISNLVEDRDFSRWDLKLATETAQNAVHDLLIHWNEREDRA